MASPSWCLISDLHFHVDDLPRLHTTCDFLVGDIKKHGCKHVLILGDTLHTRGRVDADAQNAVCEFFEQILEIASKPTLYVLVGNHDMADLTSRKVHSLRPFSVNRKGKASRLRVFNEIQKVTIDDQQVLFVPYHHEQKDIVDWVEQNIPVAERSRLVLMMHAAINGAKINGFSHNRSANANSKDAVHKCSHLTLAWLAQFKRTFSGHFHKHWIYSEQRVAYVGNPLQTSFADAGDLDKGYMLFDPKRDHIELVRNPHAAHFETLTVEQATLLTNKPTDDHIKPFSGKLVRIIIPPGTNERVVEDLRSKLTKQYCAVGVNVERYQSKQVVNKKRKRDAEKDIEDLGTVNNLDLATLVTLYIDKLISEDERQKDVLIKNRDAMLQLLNQDRSTDKLSHAKIFDGTIAELEIKNFLGIRGWRKFNLSQFEPGLWFLLGKNGFGKSTIVEAITWCLYGSLLRHGVKVDSVRNRAAGTKEECTVVVRFENGYTVERTRAKTSSLKLIAPDGKVTQKGKGVDGTQEIINKLLGVDYDTFVRTVVLSSGATTNFIASEPTEKSKIIEKLFGFDRFDDYRDHWVGETKLHTKTSDDIKSSIRREEDKIASTNEQLQSIERMEREKMVMLDNVFANRKAELDKQIATKRKQLSELDRQRQQQKPRAELLAKTRGQIEELNQKLQKLSTEEHLLKQGEYTKALEQRRVLAEHRPIIIQMTSHQMQASTCAERVKQSQLACQTLLKDRKLNVLVTALTQIKNQLESILTMSMPSAISSVLHATVLQPIVQLLNEHSNDGQNAQEMKRLTDKIAEDQQNQRTHETKLGQLLETHSSWTRSRSLSDLSNSQEMEEMRVNKLLFGFDTKFMKLSEQRAEVQKQINSQTAKMNQQEEGVMVVDYELSMQHEQQEIDRLLAELATLDVKQQRERVEALKQSSCVSEVRRLNANIQEARQEIQRLEQRKRAIEADIDVCKFWTSKLEKAKTKRAEGFRAFCMSQELDKFNQLLQTNMAILNETEQGMLAQSKISCQLSESLELLASDGDGCLQTWSGGQHRRANLAIFFTLFLLAHHRSTFRASFLFLDEIFDNLDRPGQLAAQRWVTQTLLSGHHHIKIVFLVSHSDHMDTTASNRLMLTHQGCYSAAPAKQNGGGPLVESA